MGGEKVAQPGTQIGPGVPRLRAGGIIGVHEILFGFPYQTVRLKHESITREAFGNGVLFAARPIGERENGLYSMEDLLLPYFNLDPAYGN